MKAAVAAIKAQGGTVGFMRMGLNMASGPTAIVGKRVVVVGGGFAGLEVAEAMCENREITVIEEAKKMGNGIGIIDKNPTINLVKSKGVKLMPLTKLVEVTKKGAKVQNVETGEEQLIECDTVLTSLGVEQNTKLYDEIAKAFPNAKLIGDATTPAARSTALLRPSRAATRLRWRCRRERSGTAGSALDRVLPDRSGDAASLQGRHPA